MEILEKKPGTDMLFRTTQTEHKESVTGSYSNIAKIEYMIRCNHHNYHLFNNTKTIYKYI